MEAGLLEFGQHAVLHGIDAGIGPDIQIVTPLDDQVADTHDLPLVENEHFIGHLDIPHTVLGDKLVDLLNHAVRTAIANHRFSERRIDAAEGTFERASQTRIHGRIGLPIRHAAETVPVMRPILVHGQQIPGDTTEILVEIFDNRRRRRGTDRRSLAIPEPRHLTERSWMIRFERLQQPKNRIGPLALADVIDCFVAHCTFRECGRMEPAHHERLSGNL